MSSEKAYRIVLAGDAAVGKSSFLLRLCKNEFRLNGSATLGRLEEMADEIIFMKHQTTQSELSLAVSAVISALARQMHCRCTAILNLSPFASHFLLFPNRFPQSPLQLGELDGKLNRPPNRLGGGIKDTWLHPNGKCRSHSSPMTSYI